MPEIRYTFTASEHSSVLAAFRSIEQAAGQSRAAIGAMFKTIKSRSAEAGRAMKQNIGLQFSAIERAANVAGSTQVRIAEKADKARVESARRAAQQISQIHRSETTQFKQTHREQERISQRAVAQRKGLGGRVLNAIGGRVLSAATNVALGAAAAGVYAVGRGLRENMSLEDRGAGLAVKSSTPGLDGASFTKAARQAAKMAPGVKSADVMSGMEEFVTRTGRGDMAGGMAKVLAKIGLATGSDIGELGGTAGTLMEQFGATTPQELEKQLAGLSMQGKRGAFEISDIARHIPRLGAAARVFGVEGNSEGLAKLGALAQFAQRGSGGKGGAAAATSMTNLFSDLTNKANKQTGKIGGVDIFTDKSKTKARDIFDILPEIMGDTGGDVTKLNSIFGLRSRKSMATLSPTFLEAKERRSRLGGTEEESTEAGINAVRQELLKMADTTGAVSEANRDAAAMADTSTAKMTAVWERFTSDVGVGGSESLQKFINTLNEISTNTDAFEKLGAAAGLLLDGFTALIGLAQASGLLGTPNIEEREAKDRVKKEQLEEKRANIISNMSPSSDPTKDENKQSDKLTAVDKEIAEIDSRQAERDSANKLSMKTMMPDELIDILSKDGAISSGTPITKMFDSTFGTSFGNLAGGEGSAKSLAKHFLMSGGDTGGFDVSDEARAALTAAQRTWGSAQHDPNSGQQGEAVKAAYADLTGKIRMGGGSVYGALEEIAKGMQVAAAAISGTGGKGDVLSGERRRGEF